MRTLWSIISFVSVVNLLALLMFAGWLWQSGRLSSARLLEARDLFAVTVADAHAAAEKMRLEEEEERRQQEDAQRGQAVPLDSVTRIHQLEMIRRQEDQMRQRLHQEKHLLLHEIESASLRVAQRQQELDRLRIEWEETARAHSERKFDEQFLQIVRQYEQLPPKQAKRMIVELVQNQQMSQAVAYLHAMNVRAASRILKEFKTDAEINLATELLERLRTFGREDERAQTTPALAHALTGPRYSAHAGAPAQPEPVADR